MKTRPANASTAARQADNYSLCAVGIEVRATEEVAALLRSRLRFLRSLPAQPASVVFDIRAGGDDDFAARPEGPCRAVYDTPGGQLMYFEGPDQLYLDYTGYLRLLCSPAAGLVESAVLSNGLASVLAAYPYFTVPLIEVMKRKGRFPLHAACVAREGRGVLIAGMSGLGKSTLTATLVAEGWDFLTDDMVFIARQDGAALVWGLSDEIDCTDETAGMVAELRHLVHQPTLTGRDKHPVDVEAAFGVRPVPACRPHALVLPTISGEPRSVLRTVSASYALREIAPNVLLTQSAATQAHLDALAQLVREVPCYSLAAGTDLSLASRCMQEVLG